MMVELKILKDDTSPWSGPDEKQHMDTDGYGSLLEWGDLEITINSNEKAFSVICFL